MRCAPTGSVGSLIAGFPADGPQPPILPPGDGFLFLDRDKFHASFAADLPADQAAFMADAQVPWNVAAPAGAITEASWRTRPSWYLVTTEDRMIPPSAQRTMAGRMGATQSEVTASHSVSTCRSRSRWPPSSPRPRPAPRTGRHNPRRRPTPDRDRGGLGPAAVRDGGCGEQKPRLVRKIKDLSAERSVVPRPATWLRPRPGGE
jgi:hypothetical protein